MFENLITVTARIDEIKSHFRNANVRGDVAVATHYPAKPDLAPQTVEPFFPDYLLQQVKERVKGTTEEVSSYDSLIESAAAKYGVDSALAKAVVKAESGFNPNAVSSAGARGLMQLMPSTAAGLGVTDAFDPQQNVEAGVRYLRGQLDRFGGNESLALAAYNAGPGNVMKYGGVPPFTETQNYVKKVLSYKELFK